MTDTTEEQLRGALARAAEEIDPMPSCSRLAAHDYRPRVAPRMPLITAGAATAMAAAGAGLVVGLGTGASPAFAGWTATPTTPTSGETETAESRCLDKFDSLPSRIHATMLRQTTAQAEQDVWSASTVDTRGPYTTIVFEDASGDHFSCIAGPQEGETLESSPLPPASSATPADTFTAEVLGVSWSIPQKHYLGFITGRVGPGVTAMTFTLASGTQVTATVDNGWFVAWWPSSLAGTTPGRPIASPSELAGTATPEREITSVTLTTNEGTSSVPGPVDLGTRSATP